METKSYSFSISLIKHILFSTFVCIWYNSVIGYETLNIYDSLEGIWVLIQFPNQSRIIILNIYQPLSWFDQMNREL